MGEQNERRRLPSPSMIVAGVALFVSLGGGAYASVAFNQVRSAHIKNGEVKTVDLANAAVTSAKVRNGAVTSPKIANGAVTLAKIQPAARAALRGAAGPPGPAGTGATSGFARQAASNIAFPATANTFVTVAQLSVPAGSYIVTGATNANNNANIVRNVNCRLAGQTPLVATSTIVLAANLQPGERESLAVTGGLTLTADGTIRLECQSSSTAGNYLNSKLTAIQVNMLTIQ